MQPRTYPEEHALPPEACAAYERDGFLTGLPILTPPELEGVRAAVDRTVARLDELSDRLYEVERAYTERPGEVVCHFLGGWLVEPVLRELVFDPRVTVPLAQLLGVRRLRFFHDQVFAKPPRHPGVVPWHQDYSYWTRTEPANHLTLNLVLDDADRESGCLQFVPGSHRWGLLPSLPFDSDLDAIDAHLTPGQREAFRRPHAAVLSAGQASVHHSHTLHGSGPNAGPRPRRAVVLNYMGADTRSATDEPLLAGVPPIPRGALIEGEHFPVVLDLDA